MNLMCRAELSFGLRGAIVLAARSYALGGPEDSSANALIIRSLYGRIGVSARNPPNGIRSWYERPSAFCHPQPTFMINVLFSGSICCVRADTLIRPYVGNGMAVGTDQRLMLVVPPFAGGYADLPLRLTPGRKMIR